MNLLDSYPVKFRRTGEPLARASLSAAESQLGLAFPRPYATFMLKNNGGTPSPSYLPLPGNPIKVQRFFSITNGDLVERCERQRTENGLPNHLVAIAELGDLRSFLLLDCSPSGCGRLLIWFELEEGFRHNDPEYSNVSVLYFTVDELFTKFGPAKNREDRDGIFCHLYYSSSDVRNGPKLATAFTKAGYDINFVLPGFRHPIFGAIDADAYSVVKTLLSLGTNSSHLDSLHDDATIAARLTDALAHWSGLLAATIKNGYPPGQKIAKRHIADIKSAIALVSDAHQI